MPPPSRKLDEKLATLRAMELDPGEDFGSYAILQGRTVRYGPSQSSMKTGFE